MDISNMLLEDIKRAIAYFEERPDNKPTEGGTGGFHH